MGRWHIYVMLLVVMGIGGGAGYALGASKMQHDMYRFFLITSCQNYHNELGANGLMRPNAEMCSRWVDGLSQEEFSRGTSCIRVAQIVITNGCIPFLIGMPPWPPDLPVPEGRPTLTPEGQPRTTATPIDLSQFMTP